MKLDPLKLEVLCLRREKLEEAMSALHTSLDGSSISVAELTCDAFGNFDSKRTEQLINELTAGWGMHELYRTNTGDFSEISHKKGDEYSYEWGADAQSARDFLYCALRLVGSCPWFFEGTLAEVKHFAEDLGNIQSKKVPSNKKSFSLINDVYAELNPHASFASNMDALYRLLTEKEHIATHVDPEMDEDMLAILAQEAGGEKNSSDALADAFEQKRALDAIERDARAWAQTCTDADELCACYLAFRKACIKHTLPSSFAEDIAFAIDAFLASHGASKLLDDEAFFTTYGLLQRLETRVRDGQ